MKKGDVLGHEFMGYVEDVGSKVQGVKVGDRVVVSCLIFCGECRFCKEQEYSLCDKRVTVPFQLILCICLEELNSRAMLCKGWSRCCLYQSYHVFASVCTSLLYHGQCNLHKQRHNRVFVCVQNQRQQSYGAPLWTQHLWCFWM